MLIFVVVAIPVCMNDSSSSNWCSMPELLINPSLFYFRSPQEKRILLVNCQNKSLSQSFENLLDEPAYGLIQVCSLNQLIDNHTPLFCISSTSHFVKYAEWRFLCGSFMELFSVKFGNDILHNISQIQNLFGFLFALKAVLSLIVKLQLNISRFFINIVFIV